MTGGNPINPSEPQRLYYTNLGFPWWYRSDATHYNLNPTVEDFLEVSGVVTHDN